MIKVTAPLFFTVPVVMFEPRLCTHKGCSFFGKHIENCNLCAGFGHWLGGGLDGAMIIAAEMFEDKECTRERVFTAGEYTPCSLCGGKPMRTK